MSKCEKCLWCEQCHTARKDCDDYTPVDEREDLDDYNEAREDEFQPYWRTYVKQYSEEAEDIKFRPIRATLCG